MKTLPVFLCIKDVHVLLNWSQARQEMPYFLYTIIMEDLESLGTSDSAYIQLSIDDRHLVVFKIDKVSI